VESPLSGQNFTILPLQHLIILIIDIFHMILTLSLKLTHSVIFTTSYLLPLLHPTTNHNTMATTNHNTTATTNHSYQYPFVCPIRWQIGL
jgi:hypothetical protein